MKILHVVASLAPESGGPAKACIEMARAVARRGHEVAIFTLDRGLGPEAPDLQRATEGVELRLFPEQWPHVFATSWPLAKALERDIRHFDLVHLHSLYLFHDWVTGRLCHRYRIPYLLRPHGTLDPYHRRRRRLRKWVIARWFQNRVLREAAAIHYTSEEEMRLSTPSAQGAPGCVVPNGLDLEDYAELPAPGRFRAAYPQLGNRRLLLFLGRLNYKKGLDLLVPAFAAALRQIPDLHLVIAGPDDGYRSAVERWVADQGVGARVTFTGLLLGDAKLAALRDAALFVLPSYAENFGFAVVEAMACGLPVVISDQVNIWRAVATAGAGMVGPTDRHWVARAIVELVSDPARSALCGQRGRALVTEQFSWDKIAVRLEGLYRSILGTKRI